MSSFTFRCPVYIEFGSGTAQLLPRLVGERKPLVLAYRSVPRSTVRGLLGESTRILPVGPEPDLRQLAELYAEARSEAFEVIVAIGGGSVIDAAKAVSVSRGDGKTNGADFAFVRSLWQGSEEAHAATPIIAVPTTAGSGSDVTPWATVWDKVERRKHSLNTPRIWPTVSVCDPTLTLTLPPAATRNAGLDTLAHALEALWSKQANPLSTDLAIAAARGVLKHLTTAVAEPGDLAAREAMMLAALRASLAFSNTKTGIAHALSYHLTLHRGLAHGLACGVVLPTVIEAVAGYDAAVDRSLSAALGAASSASLRQLLEKLGVPALGDHGLDHSDLDAIQRSFALTDRASNSRLDPQRLFVMLGAELERSAER